MQSIAGIVAFMKKMKNKIVKWTGLWKQVYYKKTIFTATVIFTLKKKLSDFVKYEIFKNYHDLYIIK